MARTTPQVSNDVLVDPVGAHGQTVQVGSAAWHRWLDDARTTTFRFVHPAGTFTARKEQRQGGGSYWYAYRTQGGRLRKGYLGRAEDLTLPRLEEVAARLERGHPTPVRERATSRDGHPSRRPAQAPDTGPLDAPDAILATKLYLPPPRPGLVLQL